MQTDAGDVHMPRDEYTNVIMMGTAGQPTSDSAADTLGIIRLGA